jgi:hypothetical protein
VDPQNDKNMMGNSIDNDQDIGSLWRILSQVPNFANYLQHLKIPILDSYSHIDVIGVDIW